MTDQVTRRRSINIWEKMGTNLMSRNGREGLEGVQLSGQGESEERGRNRKEHGDRSFTRM